jgi:hypothetical protein
MKIAVFTHVQPERYKKAIYRHLDKFMTDKNVQDKRLTLTDRRHANPGSEQKEDLRRERAKTAASIAKQRRDQE